VNPTAMYRRRLWTGRGGDTAGAGGDGEEPDNLTK
jgi:hypothetical protein